MYLLIAALGVGCLFQTPLIGLQASMPLKDMATTTGTFGFIRTLGGTISISVGEAILSGVSRLSIFLRSSHWNLNNVRLTHSMLFYTVPTQFSEEDSKFGY